MSEHQVKITTGELRSAANQSAYDLHNLLINEPRSANDAPSNNAEIETALDRVNYLTKRYIKVTSGKPDTDETKPEEIKTETAAVPKPAASAWG